jgi:hypothetical protein
LGEVGKSVNRFEHRKMTHCGAGPAESQWGAAGGVVRPFAPVPGSIHKTQKKAPPISVGGRLLKPNTKQTKNHKTNRENNGYMGIDATAAQTLKISCRKSWEIFYS